jgi:hypothetical protein
MEPTWDALDVVARCWILLEGLATRLRLRQRLFSGQSLRGALEVVLIAARTQTVTSLALSPGSERQAYT